jgi:predicted nucleic acid-binding protein
MSQARFSVDTNILVYSIDTDAGFKHDMACGLMDALADTDCVLTLQALAEFFHAVTRKSKMPVIETVEHRWIMGREENCRCGLLRSSQRERLAVSRVASLGFSAWSRLSIATICGARNQASPIAMSSCRAELVKSAPDLHLQRAVCPGRR